MPTNERKPRHFAPADEFLAIAPEALRAELASVWDADGWDHLYDVDTETGVAQVSVLGALESRALWFWDGYSGPAGVEARVRAALTDGRTRCLVLRLDSPGGTVAGLFECVDALRAAKLASGKPVVACIEGSGAYSAAYALATVADEVCITRVAGAGSIGVIATAVSRAEQLAQDGIAMAVVASGAQKTDLHPALPLSEAALKRLRTRVMDLAGMFAEEVSKARKLSAEDVLGMQAGCFYGEAAVSAGLADHVGTCELAATRALAIADQRAEEARRREHMSTLNKILGLAPEASPEDQERETARLATFAREVLELSAQSDGPSALGALRAWKVDAGKYENAAKELAALRTSQDTAECARMLDEARKDGRVTPADEASEDWKAMHTLARASGMPAVRAFFKTLRKAVPTEPVQPAQGDAGAETLTEDEKRFGRQAGLTDEQMMTQKRADAARARTR
jgi:ClpP class serine protease